MLNVTVAAMITSENSQYLGYPGNARHDVVLEDVFIPKRHTWLVAPLEEPGTVPRTLYLSVVAPAIDSGSEPSDDRHSNLGPVGFRCIVRVK